MFYASYLCIGKNIVSAQMTLCLTFTATWVERCEYRDLRRRNPFQLDVQQPEEQSGGLPRGRHRSPGEDNYCRRGPRGDHRACGVRPPTLDLKAP